MLRPHEGGARLLGAALASVLMLLTAGCTVASPAPKPVQKGPAWGTEVKGLRARLNAPAEIEQNAPLAVSFELRCDPAFIPPGVTGFNRCLADAHLQLTLTNVTTGQAFEIGSREYSGPLLVADDASPLDGTPLKPVQTEFPLRAAGDGLKPGAYDCAVSYSSEKGQQGCAQRTPPERLWRGEFRTVPVRLTIKPEVLRPVVFAVPRRLRLTRDLQVVYLSEDTDRVTAMLGNGMYVGRKILCHSGAQLHFQELGGVPPPTPGGSNRIDDWSLQGRRPVNGKLEYTIEVFATSDPGRHDWAPEESDYKTLWKKEFLVTDNTPRK